MRKLDIGLLNKKRRNFQLQEKFAGFNMVVDATPKEVVHHREALIDAGYNVCTIEWGPDFINDLRKANVDLVFNVSSMVEAAILEEIEMPYVGSDTFTIAIAADKSLTKRMWQQVGLPTSPFHVAKTEADCRIFKEKPPFDYPLFIKPLAGRGSAGINEKSVIENYDQLVEGVLERYETIGQPVLIERFLKGREITFGILGNDEDIRALPPLEIVFSEGEVTLTYEQKEMDNDLFFCPAKLTKEETLEMRLLAIKAYINRGRTLLA
ncbi:MAG: D-alanine--D-alanine ligase family protein [Candidatus Heimdallarchaeaceae archaeon]